MKNSLNDQSQCNFELQVFILSLFSILHKKYVYLINVNVYGNKICFCLMGIISETLLIVLEGINKPF